jgi:hypothetical protein
MKEGGGGDTNNKSIEKMKIYEEKLKKMVLVHKQEVNRMKRAHKKEIQSKTSNTFGKSKNEVDEYIFLGLTLLTVFFLLYLFVNPSTLIITSFYIVIVLSALLWTKTFTVTTMWGAVSQFAVLMLNSSRAVKCVWVDSTPPTSCKNVQDISAKTKLAEKDFSVGDLGSIPKVKKSSETPKAANPDPPAVDPDPPSDPGSRNTETIGGGVESGICSDLKIVQTLEKDHFAKASPSPVHEESVKNVSNNAVKNASRFFCLAPEMSKLDKITTRSFPYNPG